MSVMYKKRERGTISSGCRSKKGHTRMQKYDTVGSSNGNGNMFKSFRPVIRGTKKMLRNK